MGKQCKHIIPNSNAYANKLIYGLYFITSYSLIAACTICTLYQLWEPLESKWAVPKDKKSIKLKLQVCRIYIKLKFSKKCGSQS